MTDNPFVLPVEQYQRNINPLRHYVEDAAKFLSIQTGKAVEECEAYVRTALRPGGRFELQDPRVLILERDEKGDRNKVETTLRGYLGDSLKNRELIAPTLTTYLPPQVKESLLVDYIDGNVKARSKAKKEMFAAKVAGDKPLFALKKGEQTNKKLANNAISGAHVSASTPLYNRTAHSTLTSNCRSTSGYGNANNEKFLCGNRHYWSSTMVFNNITSIVNHTDYAQFSAVMEQYGIRHPSVEETMACIRYSTDLYWTTPGELAKVRAYVEKLADIQRSAFVYTGDLYHLRVFNPGVVHRFISELATSVPVVHPDARAIMEARSIPEDHLHLAVMLNLAPMRGKDMSKVVGTDAEGLVVSTALNIGHVLQKYRNLIRAFWVTDNVPASVAWFPESVRRAAITSDTDSTIFTVQDWVTWHQGYLSYSQMGSSVASVMIFLAAQTITHVLAKMSANFGIEQKRMFQVAMKNEYKFDVFIPTQVAKHYYAIILAQEGDVRMEYEAEIKGVHLKSSNAPVAVMKQASKMMMTIMETVAAEKKIKILPIFKEIADLERSVKASIARGSYEYFKRVQIKTAESYTKAKEDSPYAAYLMWQEVFAPKYGDTPAPPYAAIKVSCDLSSPAKTQEWLQGFQDQELANRMRQFLNNKGRKQLGTTFVLPEQCISSQGIPQEILDAIGVRKIVLETCSVFYLILESLGFYFLEGKGLKLVSDFY